MIKQYFLRKTRSVFLMIFSRYYEIENIDKNIENNIDKKFRSMQN